jgi:hypothetical protein
MSHSVINAIISASAALLGALLGFAGSVRANRHALEVARVQRRYERVQDMRAEVLPKLYGYLQDIHDSQVGILQRVLDEVTLQVAPSKLSEEIHAQVAMLDQSTKRWQIAYTYWRDYHLWIPGIDLKAWYFLDGFERQHDTFKSHIERATEKLEELLEEQPEETATQVETSILEIMVNAHRESATDYLVWLHGEGYNLLDEFRVACVEILAIDEA